MTLPILASKESSLHTATLPLERVSNSQVTGTVPARCPVFFIDPTRERKDELPSGYVSIDSIAERAEANPTRVAAMERAWCWVADSFYEDSKPLQLLRLRKGFSQARLAARIGTTQAHIARIEAGSADVQVGTLVRMAEALDLAPLDIISAFLTQRATNS